MAHEYKVGDLVRILPRDGLSSDYMYSFAEGMLPLIGQVCKITHISRNDHNGSSQKKLDDGHMYLLEGNPFTWASSMFEPYDEKKITSPKFKEGDIVEILPRQGESTEATPIKSDQERLECPYQLVRESQENYNLNFNM